MTYLVKKCLGILKQRVHIKLSNGPTSWRKREMFHVISFETVIHLSKLFHCIKVQNKRLNFFHFVTEKLNSFWKSSTQSFNPCTNSSGCYACIVQVTCQISFRGKLIVYVFKALQIVLFWFSIEIIFQSINEHSDNKVTCTSTRSLNWTGFCKARRLESNHCVILSMSLLPVVATLVSATWRKNSCHFCIIYLKKSQHDFSAIEVCISCDKLPHHDPAVYLRPLRWRSSSGFLLPKLHNQICFFQQQTFQNWDRGFFCSMLCWKTQASFCSDNPSLSALGKNRTLDNRKFNYEYRSLPWATLSMNFLSVNEFLVCSFCFFP